MSQISSQNLSPLRSNNTSQKQVIKNAKTKELGQVFTPEFIVDLMLENKALLGRVILEPGCGEGAFLTKITRLYIKEFANLHQNLLNQSDLNTLKNELESNIIGIEIDEKALQICRKNLDKIAFEFGLKNVKWNLYKGDFLELYSEFVGKIDLVIGNPPYVRVHNLIENARKFTRGGMGDLFLIFFELGLKCLKNKGNLCFITPSSWFNSKAGAHMRKQIAREQNLVKIIDFSHEKIFEKITTYSAISFFKKDKKCDEITFCDYQKNEKRTIKYGELFLQNGEIFLGKKVFKKILNIPPLAVKNGFATLCDEFFFGDFTQFEYPKIRALKASNGKWFDCIFPYENGSFKAPQGAVLKRYELYEKRLKGRDLRGQDWREFGRTQGIKDTNSRKIAFNTLIKELKDLRIYELKAGEGIFGGLYLVSDLPLSAFENALKTAEFLDFVKSLRKYKNGGYYTFSSVDLGRFLAWKFAEKEANLFEN